MTNKRVAIIAVSSIILVAIGCAVTVGVVKSHNSENEANATDKQASSSMKAVEALCAPTDFKQTCVNSLKGTNSSDPKELIKVGFNAAVKNIQDAVKKSSVLRELEKDPRAAQALKYCKELMDDSVDELRRSFEKVGDFDISKLDDIVRDLKVWLSAAITYQETCFDGFENTTSDAGKKMREFLKTATQMTSNGLAMVTEVGDSISSLNLDSISSRRLLSSSDDALSVWGPEMRKLMSGSSDDNDDANLSIWAPEMRRLMAAKPTQIKPNMVIAKDGSGKYKTINEALKDIPKHSNKTFVIYIKGGVYNEQVTFNKSFTHLLVLGDGPTKTRITYNLNYADGVGTYKTATVAVLGDFFVAKDIGFENTAGAIKHQAVALRVQADHAVFYNCHMDGYQDTLYTHALRQYYRNCVISGTIDFVFGDASAVFQNCTFLIRKPLENQQCIVTAQGRKERRQPSAIVLSGCSILPDKTYVNDGVIKSYLGRPWKEYSRTIIMDTYIDGVIDPDGWLPWMGTFGINTCFYTEINNKGPGSSTKNRVKWRGVKTITPQHALDFAPGKFISGDRWIPQTGVPYTPGRFQA